jgi:hypothetical protein
MPGPIYINGLMSPPPEYDKLSPPPPDVDGRPPPAPPKREKKEEKKDNVKTDEQKKKEKKQNLNALPKMPPGCNYMVDRDHTMLHIFSKTSPIWEAKYKDSPQ